MELYDAECQIEASLTSSRVPPRSITYPVVLSHHGQSTRAQAKAPYRQEPLVLTLERVSSIRALQTLECRHAHSVALVLLLLEVSWCWALQLLGSWIICLQTGRSCRRGKALFAPELTGTMQHPPTLSLSPSLSLSLPRSRFLLHLSKSLRDRAPRESSKHKDKATNAKPIQRHSTVPNEARKPQRRPNSHPDSL